MSNKSEWEKFLDWKEALEASSTDTSYVDGVKAWKDAHPISIFMESAQTGKSVEEVIASTLK